MRLVFWAGFWSFLIDQVSKYVVIHMMELSRVLAIDVLPPFLNFRYGENCGINFGLFGACSDIQRWLLVALAIGIVALVLFWLGRSQVKTWGHIGAGLLIGGALGNVVDRVLYGYVLDFLNMSCCGIRNPFVFNLADVFIVLGALGLVLFVEDPKKTVQ